MSEEIKEEVSTPEEVKEETTVVEANNEAKNNENEVKEPNPFEDEENKEVYKTPIDVKDVDEATATYEITRKNFNDTFNKSKKINLLLAVVFIVLVLICLMVFGTQTPGIVLVIILLIAYFVIISKYSKGVKAKMEKDANQAIVDYFAILDSLITKDECFENVEFHVDNKIKKTLVLSLKICKDISYIGTRDHIKGNLYGYNFESGDCVVKTSEKKEDGSIQDYIVFLGKLFTINMPLDIKEGRAIIYLKGNGANGPTDIDDLTKQEGLLSDKFDVYASCDLSKVLTEEVVQSLEAFEKNELLIDAFIVLENGRLSVGLSYGDDVMKVPLFDGVIKDSIEQYVNDYRKITTLVKALKK